MDDLDDVLERKPEPDREGMTEDELVAILKQEESDASSYHSSELADNQAQAIDRYYARPYGDEREGRSRVVMHDIEDTINWIMPSLMRVFLSSDELVSLEAVSPEDELEDPNAKVSRVKLGASYLEHIFFKDNKGETNIHDFAFDGLLQRQGVMHVAWEDPEDKPADVIEGASAQLVEKYATDPGYEITGIEPQPDGTFVLEFKKRPGMGKVCVEAVPPEEFAVSRRAKSLADASYHRRKRRVYLVDLIRQFPDQEEGLREFASSGDSFEIESDPRFTARHQDEGIDTSSVDGNRLEDRQVELLEEFKRIDFDGDGIVELRHVKRVGNVVLYNERVDRSEYVAWTPIRVSHKIAGRSMYDVLVDLQKIRTVIMRRILDSLDQSLTPQKAVDVKRLGADGLNDLLDNEVGGVIRTQGNPNEAVMTLTTPDVSGPALTVMEYMDQRSEEASGVTRHAQGLAPKAITDTFGGIEALQAAANSRIEMVARWLGVALEEVFQHILCLVCAHQDKPRMVKVLGKWFEIDPRSWSDEMSVRIHVGMSAANRQQQINNLSMIAAKQETILLKGGFSNPLVGLRHYRTTLARLTQAMGYKDADQFWGEITQEPAPQEQPDPKMEEIKLKAQADQAKLAAEAQHNTAKLAQEREIALARIASEREIAMERTNREMELAAWKAQVEAQLAERKSQREAFAGIGQGANDDLGGKVRMGGQIG